MDRILNGERTGQDGHPPEEDLFLYVDGELPARKAAYMRTHLDACWSCRVRTEKVQEAITSFVDYRNRVLRALVPSPPHGWRDFDSKLKTVVAESGKRSFRSGLRELIGLLGKPLAAAQAFASSVRHAHFPARRVVRFAAAVLTIVIAAALVLRLTSVPAVSANELLDRAAQASADQIRRVPQAVVHQKLRIKRTAPKSVEETAGLEVWDDKSGSRVRDFLTTEGENIPVAIEGMSGARKSSVFDGLTSALKANGMDYHRPLSIGAFQEWRNSLPGKKESVEKSRLSSGLDLLTLTVGIPDAVKPGQISEASLIVRARDWHPIEQRLSVKSTEGESEYDVVETDFEVLSLDSIEARVFGSTPAATAPAVSRSEKPEASPSPVAEPSASAIVAATPDLEVQVLSLLSESGADLTEQITVDVRPDKLLEVRGIVETDQRKTELLNALGSVIHNPAVRVDIETVAEAVAKQPHKGAGAAAVPDQHAEIANNSIAADPELRRYFSARGIADSEIDDAIRQFSRNVLQHSQLALFQASALRRVADRFTDAELKSLSSDGRAKWLAIIRQHAAAVQSQTAALMQALGPVVGNKPAAALPGDDALAASDASRRDAIKELFELANGNDQVFRSAFALSTGSANISVINTPQFWQLLVRTEALAGSIARGQ